MTEPPGKEPDIPARTPEKRRKEGCWPKALDQSNLRLMDGYILCRKSLLLIISKIVCLISNN
jgi:hypothetical protein